MTVRLSDRSGLVRPSQGCAAAQSDGLAKPLPGFQLAADAAIDSNRADLLGTAIGEAVDLISQGLLAALDYERGGEIATNLGSIYDYALRRLLHANLRKDVKVVREIADLLAGLREAWVSIQQGASPDQTRG